MQFSASDSSSCVDRSDCANTVRSWAVAQSSIHGSRDVCVVRSRSSGAIWDADCLGCWKLLSHEIINCIINNYEYMRLDMQISVENRSLRLLHTNG